LPSRGLVKTEPHNFFWMKVRWRRFDFGQDAHTVGFTQQEISAIDATLTVIPIAEICLEKIASRFAVDCLRKGHLVGRVIIVGRIVSTPKRFCLSLHIVS
jgi:hypothetical protein